MIRRNTRNIRRTRFERRSMRNNNRNTARTRRFESTYNVDDIGLKKWAAEHCIDRLSNLEGAEIYMDDLATELTERENMDGTVFMSTQKSWDFISKNRYDAMMPVTFLTHGFRKQAHANRIRCLTQKVFAF